MKQICDYDNYSKYAAEPKLREKEYFYKLLDYNKQCIKYMKVKSVFQHLKDEEMKNYYQWICDNAKITVEAMYEYIKGEKYDNPEQRKENILFLIDIFPDAMSQCIDAEFLINNWNTLDDNFKNKCTSDGLNNFFDGIAKISDIEKKEKWYMYLLQISPVYCFTLERVTAIFALNFHEFSEETVETCIELFKKNNAISNLLSDTFSAVNNWTGSWQKEPKPKLKAEKTLWLIKTFGAKRASEHVDKDFLIKNLNDKDIGNIVNECIKLCAEADDKFCKSLYKAAENAISKIRLNDFGNYGTYRQKIILDLINICKEKIFEHVDNQFLLENLDKFMILLFINLDMFQDLIMELLILNFNLKEMDNMEDIVGLLSKLKIVI